jgi:hypothetical protein
MAYKAAKSYLRRNDKEEEESPSFQAAVNNQREASNAQAVNARSA